MVDETPQTPDAKVSAQPAEVPTLATSVEAARGAQTAWEACGLDARVALMLEARTRVLQRADAIADAIAAETGKPRVEALLGEVLATADVFSYWCDALEDELEPRELSLDPVAYPGKHAFTSLTARGVIAAIMPWNFPFALPLRTIVPALLTGNAILLKPSEVTPRTGALIAEIFEGLIPPNVFRVIQGDGEVGARLIECDVDLVVFTGSPRAGRAVARSCAERLIPCELELGGKDAAIVLADCDVKRSARGIVWAAMMNAGQNCGAVERVYVERPVAEAMRKALVEEVKALVPGRDVGPLTTDGQARVVERHLADAKAAGAQILAGGGPVDGRMCPPTLLEVDSDDLSLMREETFGPLLPMRIVEDGDEAVRLANASRYGLTASVWSRDTRRAESIASQLRVGVVTVNAHSFTGALPGAPWGGRGESGWGVTGSPFALHAVTRPKLVLVDRSSASRELYWFPYTDVLERVARALILVRGGAKSLGERVGALWQLVANVVSRLRA